MDKETVDRAMKEAEEAYTKMSLLKDAYLKAEKDYLKKGARFRNFDYELAQTDGRLKKVSPKGERKDKKQPELTLDQIKGIADKLGIKLTVETEEVIEEVEELEEEDNERSEEVAQS